MRPVSPRYSHLKYIVFTVHNNVDDVKIMQNIFHVIYYSRGPCYRCLALHSSQIINFASVYVICVTGTIGTIVINVYWSPSKLDTIQIVYKVTTMWQVPAPTCSLVIWSYRVSQKNAS